MNETTDRLMLPLLAAGQAQKEMTHNAALELLDLLVQPAVEAVGQNVPPAVTTPGACWITGDAPQGDWTGRPHTLAGWTAGGWRFAAPRQGTAVWNRANGHCARFADGAWQDGVLAGTTLRIHGQQVVGSRAAAIADPGGGTVVDGEARAAIGAILAALRNHGLIAG